jgi:phage/plasmid primase-like uncharacterized protein
MITLEDFLARLKRVRRCGGGWVALCPAHDDHTASLSIGRSEQGKVLIHCFAGCTYESVIDALGGQPWSNPPRNPERKTNLAQGRRDNSEWARQIWRESREAPGTIVQDYTFGRGFTDSPPQCLRFHPGLRHPSGVSLPAMVAAIDDLGGEIVGIHRTFLKRDGTGKAAVEPNKMALGKLGGGAVRLTAGAPELILSEGIETGLSILQATGRHVWAALGTSNLGRVELPDFVRRIIIGADQDDSGIKAATVAANTYRARGYQVAIVSPDAEKTDFNDVLRR